MLTRCTHCDTAFRITPEDLSLARGRVRCGQCMRTFDALQKLTDELEQQQLGYEVEYLGEAQDIGQPQDLTAHEDIGQPQDITELEDIGQPQDITAHEDIGQPQGITALEDIGHYQDIGKAWTSVEPEDAANPENPGAPGETGDAWITSEPEVSADALELHALSYGDLDEELLNTHTMPAIPGLVEHPDFGFDEEPTPEPENSAQEKLPLSWDDSWDEMAFDDEHGIPLNEAETEQPSTWLTTDADEETGVNQAQASLELDTELDTEPDTELDSEPEPEPEPEPDTRKESLDELAETCLLEDSRGTTAEPTGEQPGPEPDAIPESSAGDPSKMDISRVQAELEGLAKLVQSEPRLAPEEHKESGAGENFDQVVRKRRSGAARVASGLLALILTLGLGAQVVHYYRESLLPHPTVGPVLKQAYQRLGVALPAEWELDRYDVRQLGGVQDPARPGVLIIGISIRNQASRSQPYPIIRLVLEDRWGERIAKSDLNPADYLAEDAKPGAMMRAGQMIKTDIAVIEPEGASATNFQIDACMPNENGTLNCANKL